MWYHRLLFVAATAAAHNFVLHEAPLSWPDAAASCRATGGRLAKVEDAAEQAALAQHTTTQAVWIGGSDEAKEGEWRWDAVDGGTLPASAGATGARAAEPLRGQPSPRN